MRDRAVTFCMAPFFFLYMAALSLEAFDGASFGCSSCSSGTFVLINCGQNISVKPAYILLHYECANLTFAFILANEVGSFQSPAHQKPTSCLNMCQKMEYITILVRVIKVPFVCAMSLGLTALVRFRESHENILR